MTEPLIYNPTGQTLFERVGGDSTFEQLVDHFYKLVEEDDDLRPLFPDDLEPGKQWQFLFLTQYWGGPARYQDQRGHPRLRMRHMPFAIDQQARDLWVQHMVEAIDFVGIPDPDRHQMVEYFERGATFMMNR